MLPFRSTENCCGPLNVGRYRIGIRKGSTRSSTSIYIRSCLCPSCHCGGKHVPVNRCVWEMLLLPREGARHPPSMVGHSSTLFSEDGYVLFCNAARPGSQNHEPGKISINVSQTEIWSPLSNDQWTHHRCDEREPRTSPFFSSHGCVFSSPTPSLEYFMAHFRNPSPHAHTITIRTSYFPLESACRVCIKLPQPSEMILIKVHGLAGQHNWNSNRERSFEHLLWSHSSPRHGIPHI